MRANGGGEGEHEGAQELRKEVSKGQVKGSQVWRTFAISDRAETEEVVGSGEGKTGQGRHCQQTLYRAGRRGTIGRKL